MTVFTGDGKLRLFFVLGRPKKTVIVASFDHHRAFDL